MTYGLCLGIQLLHPWRKDRPLGPLHAIKYTSPYLCEQILRIRLGEVPGRRSQRLGIAWRCVGKRDRLVEQLRILRGGEPLALLTGRVTNEVRQNDTGGLSGYFFATARNHPRNVAARFAEIA
jgi:hypothetical protein